MSETVLELKNLTKRYDAFVLQNITMSVCAGETLGLVGANGAGKTTLMKCILGLTPFDEGEVRIFGQDAPHGATSLMREDIGVVFDTLRFPPGLSLRGVGRLMAATYRNWDPALFDGYVRALNISPFKKLTELSRGSGMKLGIACALSHRPKLLLLDEATAGLDPMVRDDVLDILRAFQVENDCGMVLCTHITSDLEKISDNVMCLDAGKTAFCCPREDITDAAGIVRCRRFDLDALVEQEVFPAGTMCFEQGPYSCNLLVEDRFAFKERFPELPCDGCTIEDYMRILLKGERR